MYALIDLKKVREVRSSRFYETIPDGRAIVPLSELRAFGTLENVDIVATANELKKLIEKQKEQGVVPPQEVMPEEGTMTEGTVVEQPKEEEQLPPVEELPLVEEPTTIPLTEKGGNNE